MTEQERAGKLIERLDSCLDKNIRNIFRDYLKDIVNDRTTVEAIIIADIERHGPIYQAIRKEVPVYGEDITSIQFGGKKGDRISSTEGF